MTSIYLRGKFVFKAMFMNISLPISLTTTARSIMRGTEPSVNSQQLTGCWPTFPLWIEPEAIMDWNWPGYSATPADEPLRPQMTPQCKCT